MAYCGVVEVQGPADALGATCVCAHPKRSRSLGEPQTARVFFPVHNPKGAKALSPAPFPSNPRSIRDPLLPMLTSCGRCYQEFRSEHDPEDGRCAETCKVTRSAV